MRMFPICTVGMISVVSIASCASQGPGLRGSGFEQQEIREVAVSEKGITISGNQPFVYLVIRDYQDSSQPQLVVFLKETELGQYRQPMLVNKGPVTEIVPYQKKGNSQWTTELRIGLNRLVDYHVKEQGNKLIINFEDEDISNTPEVAFKTEAEFPKPYRNDMPSINLPLNDFHSEYVIGPEDVLEILVWKNNDLSKVVTVRPDGMISLPLIGDVQTAGRTASALREVIRKRLGEFQKVPEVSVIIQQVNSYNIFILGQVARPGKYQLKSHVTLLQAISLAGGFTQFASKNNIKVLRKKYGEAQVQTIKIRYKDIISKGLTSENILLKRNDTVIVP